MGRNTQGGRGTSPGATCGKGLGSSPAEGKVLVNVHFRHTTAVRKRVWLVSGGVSVPVPGVGVLYTQHTMCVGSLPLSWQLPGRSSTACLVCCASSFPAHWSTVWSPWSCVLRMALTYFIIPLAYLFSVVHNIRYAIKKKNPISIEI